MEMMVVAIQYSIRFKRLKYVAVKQYVKTIPNVLFILCNKSDSLQNTHVFKDPLFFLLQDSSEALTWEKRTKISLGLIKAIQHLHQFGIIHGNIKRWGCAFKIAFTSLCILLYIT